MSRLSSVLFAASLAVSTTACLDMDEGEFDSSSGQAATGELGLHGAPEPHLMHQKGDVGPPTGGGSSPLLKSGGGPVLVANKTAAIFWGSEWNTTTFADDKISGLTLFFQGFGGSTFANTNTEYTAGTAKVTNASTFAGSAIDPTTPPRKALSVSQAVAKACDNKSLSDDPANTVYFIYTSTGAGHVNYCAWHSYGTCSDGTVIQVAYMPNIDGLAGCDPGNPYSVPGNQGLRALVNVTAHELSEAITDPHLNAWKDSGGSENADKCAWKWDGKLTFSNGTEWMAQMNWSNAAYNLGVTHSGVKGCIQQEALPFDLAWDTAAQQTNWK